MTEEEIDKTVREFLLGNGEPELGEASDLFAFLDTVNDEATMNAMIRETQKGAQTEDAQQKAKAAKFSLESSSSRSHFREPARAQQAPQRWETPRPTHTTATAKPAMRQPRLGIPLMSVRIPPPTLSTPSHNQVRQVSHQQPARGGYRGLAEAASINSSAILHNSSLQPAIGGASLSQVPTDPTSEEECPICTDVSSPIVGINLACFPFFLQKLEDEEVYTHSCRKRFHDRCFRHWLTFNSTCPNCRAHVTMEDEYPSLQLSSERRKRW